MNQIAMSSILSGRKVRRGLRWACGLAVALHAGAGPALAEDVHVSPLGDDAAAGTETQPFRTVQRAQRAVRQRIAGGLSEAITVILHGGVYELSEPLVFGPADSGTESAAITYTARANESVVISGGSRISNWKVSADGHWTAQVPDAKAGRWFFRQLVVDGKQAVRARWPDKDDGLRIASVDQSVTNFTFKDDLPPGNLAGQGAELVVFEHWSITRGLITASVNGQITTATPMGWIGHGQYTTAVPGRFCFIEHARAALDQPGEWFLDKATGTLHYIPREGEVPAKTVAIAPRLERLVVIAGTKGKPVRNIRFKGIRFEHADFPLPAVGYNEIQAAHYGTTMKDRTFVRSVAIECAWAERVRFERCGFAHLNPSGIGLGPGCKHNAIVGCTVEDIGGNGVMIGWRGVGELDGENLASDWKDPTDAPTGNEIVNCIVRRCGLDSRGGCGVFAAFSVDTRIAHNHIHDLPYTGISIGFRWTPTPTTQTRCVVEHNHIHDVMKQLADGGGIYTLGIQPGTVLRANHIHDVHRRKQAVGAPNNGFFIDQASQGYHFENNVVYRTTGSPVRFNRSGHGRHTWKDNFFGTHTPPANVRGKVGKAMIFDGASSVIEAAHAPALEPQHLTLEAWVYLTEFPGGGDNRRWIVNKNANEWADGHYALMIHGDRVGAFLNIGGGQANVYGTWSADRALKLERWHHLAMTYDGSKLTVMLDGQQVAARTIDKQRKPGSSAVAIGRRQDGFRGSHFKGRIDEVRIYDRALDTDELAAHYNKPEPVRDMKSERGLVGYWSFDNAADADEPSTAADIIKKAGPQPEYRRDTATIEQGG